MSITRDDSQDNMLLARLDELVRWRPGSKGKYLDLHSALSRIQGNTNHVITGRRGSGKTRLLDELRTVARTNSVCVVSIGAEDYKELTYPDILIQILRKFLHEFRNELTSTHDFLSSEWFGYCLHAIMHPIKTRKARRSLAELKNRATTYLATLDKLLAESDELETETTETKAGEAQLEQSVQGNLLAGKFSGGVKFVNTGRTGSNRLSKQKELKRIKVERLLSDFKRLLSDFCTHFETKLVLAVDDFYFVRREDQPKVIDYMHRICKDTQSYLKVATIKHRTELFEFGDVARGVVQGHEIQPIDLELPLGEFTSITQFLRSIWISVCAEIEIERPEPIFIGDGFEHAVLASGGVPRDFFGIVKGALLIARERRESGIGKRRINEAARTYAESTKLPELGTDIDRDQGLLELLLYDIIRFSREEKKKNCFYINLETLESSPDLRLFLDALADSRLIHLISDNTSSTRRTGRFAAYLLDVGLYGHPERRGDRAVDEVKFWARDKQGRLMNLSRAPIYPMRSITELETALQDIRSQGKDVRTSLLDPKDEQLPDNMSSGTKALQLALPFVDEQ